MGYKEDTVTIIGDSGSKTVYLYTRTSSYSASNKTMPVQTTTIVETATVQIFPARSRSSGRGFTKDERGELVDYTHVLYFPYTSTVSVGMRIIEDGQTDYYEVMRVDPFEDHNRVYGKLVEGRT